MAADYDEAITELFQAPHGESAATRKRLQGELKEAGDKAGATKLGKLNRPPLSAWAVNQLWWQAREEFDQFLETAERLRDGDLAGAGAHREALAGMRARASEILLAADHAATEATLRRIATTLSAIAATGSFDPDPPGALTDDRDPPGFEAAAVPTAAVAAETASRLSASADQRRAEDTGKKKRAERERDEAALRTAVGEVERRVRDVERLRKATSDAEVALEKSRAIVTDLERKLAED